MQLQVRRGDFRATVGVEAILDPRRKSPEERAIRMYGRAGSEALEAAERDGHAIVQRFRTIGASLGLAAFFAALVISSGATLTFDLLGVMFMVVSASVSTGFGAGFAFGVAFDLGVAGLAAGFAGVFLPLAPALFPLPFLSGPGSVTSNVTSSLSGSTPGLGLAATTGHAAQSTARAAHEAAARRARHEAKPTMEARTLAISPPLFQRAATPAAPKAIVLINSRLSVIDLRSPAFGFFLFTFTFYFRTSPSTSHNPPTDPRANRHTTHNHSDARHRSASRRT